jgi:hypothetical protein
MGAGAAGRAMDRPRLLLLLLLGVSASQREDCSLPRERNPEGSRVPPSRKQNRVLGSQMLGVGSGEELRCRTHRGVCRILKAQR